MKRLALMFLAVAVLMTAGCKGGQKAGKAQANAQESAQEEQSAPEQDTFMAAIERFLTDSIAP